MRHKYGYQVLKTESHIKEYFDKNPARLPPSLITRSRLDLVIFLYLVIMTTTMEMYSFVSIFADY